MIASLDLSQPLALFGLLAVPLYAVLRHRLLKRDVVPYPPLQYRAGRRRRLASRLRLPVELMLLSVAVLALAGPYRSTPLELVEDEGVDALLVLDVSLSMLAEDFPPNRLEALRAVAHDFLARSGGHRLGLVIFAKDVFVQAPLTTDRVALRALLDSVTALTIDQTKSGGTAIGDALLVAAERLGKARRPGRDQAVVLITDGESNAGVEPLLAARYLRQQGIRLYIIGIGGEEPVEVFFEGRRVGGDAPYLAVLDDTQLRAVAEAAAGRFYRASDAGMLADVFAQLSRLESAPLEVRRLLIRRPWTHLLAVLLLPLFAAYLVLGGVVLRRPLR